MGIVGEARRQAARLRQIGRLRQVEATDQALAGLMGLIARFDLPETPYLSQPRGLAPRFSDYAHLARVKEWSAGGEG